MAITLSGNGSFSGASTVDQSTYTTSTFTPGLAAGSVVILTFLHTVASGTIGDATSVSGSSVTGMTKFATVAFNSIASPLDKIELWVGTSTGTASTIAIAIPNVPTGCSWNIVEASGVDTGQGTTGALGVGATNQTDSSTTAWSVTLPTFASVLNRGVGGGGLAAAADWNTNGWTRGNATSYLTPSSTAGSCFGAANTPGATMTWTSAAPWAGIAVELAAASVQRGQDPIVSSAAVRRAATW